MTIHDLVQGARERLVQAGISANLAALDAEVLARQVLGWDQARGSASVCVVEGVFDLLAVRQWGYPVVGLLGTNVRPDQVDQLRAFSRAYLVLDTDDAGFEATLALYDAIGPTAVPVALPDDVKDPAELATRGDGQGVFAAALLKAVGKPAPDETFDAAPEADL